MLSDGTSPGRADGALNIRSLAAGADEGFLREFCCDTHFECFARTDSDSSDMMSSLLYTFGGAGAEVVCIDSFEFIVLRVSVRPSEAVLAFGFMFCGRLDEPLLARMV